MDPENKVAKISIQDRDILLNEGEWSEWVQVEFPLIPYLQRVSGICRFYLREVRPHFKLYVTPINIDPSAPALPISTPGDYSRELWEKVGFFYTQGMPEDTKALSEDILDDEAFLEQARIVLHERLKLFEHELSRFRQGLLFFYFGSSDQLAHMFWHAMDKKHPAHNPNTKYLHAIKDVYREMDACLGRALEEIDSETTLIVMSDHGFAPFYRSFNLNTWLKKEGYLSLIDESIQGKKEFFQNVDWSKTQAYGLGLNGFYLNLAGREINGIVRPGPQKEKLINEIIRKLLKVKDPKTNDQVIYRVYRPEDIYSGPYIKDAPDLLIGYNWGYRASWETTIGKLPKEIFADNTNKWSGDHCIAAELVPGIILSNKKIKITEPSLHDLAPTILAEFGIDKESMMVGESIF
jgi:predicted AlkP superfamily phosphohydrolase/phosphomutase